MKSYMIFTPRLQKIIQFTLVPVVAVVAAGGISYAQNRLAGGVWSEDTRLFGHIFSNYLLNLVVIFDMFFDRNMFGGSFSSHTSNLEYMKTSHRGLTVYHDVLRGSMAVRFLYVVGVMGLFRLVYFLITPETIYEAICAGVFFAGVAFISVQIGVLFCRLFAAENVAMVTGLLGTVLVNIAITILALIGSDQRIGFLIVGLAALCLGTVLAVAMVMVGKKKKEKEYADS